MNIDYASSSDESAEISIKKMNPDNESRNSNILPQESHTEEEDEFDRQYRLLNEEIDREQEPKKEKKVENNSSFQSSPVSNFNSVAEEIQHETPVLDTEESGGISESNADSDRKDSTTTEKVRNILTDHGLLSVQLPAYNTNPVKTPSDSIKEKIINWTGLRDRGLFFNARLLNTHEFRNPHIMNKMLDYMELDSHASNLSKAMYDPAMVSSLPHYEELVARKAGSAAVTNNKYATSSNKKDPKSFGKKREGLGFQSGPRKRI